MVMRRSYAACRRRLARNDKLRRRAPGVGRKAAGEASTMPEMCGCSSLQAGYMGPKRRRALLGRPAHVVRLCLGGPGRVFLPILGADTCSAAVAGRARDRRARDGTVPPFYVRYRISRAPERDRSGRFPDALYMTGRLRRGRARPQSGSAPSLRRDRQCEPAHGRAARPRQPRDQGRHASRRGAAQISATGPAWPTSASLVAMLIQTDRLCILDRHRASGACRHAPEQAPTAGRRSGGQDHHQADLSAGPSSSFQRCSS